MFNFLKKKRISGKEIDLVLNRLLPENKLFNYPKTYVYDIVLHKTNEIVGMIDIRKGMDDELYYYGNIGYHIYRRYRGNRYAYQACLLILKTARDEKMDELIITCNPDNQASYRTCELLGAELIEIVDVPEDHELYRLGEKRKCIFRLDVK